ncbi:MAG TPA: gamma-glutamylcyclotransferase family protein [Candidatus Saccharimonadales bacterium]|nr:gamma-glutamylcyclotransferase family protein [Candidatus Saccharimonadales bacterium]
MKARAAFLQAVLLVLYFAYGSNLDWAQMQRRCPDAQFRCVAKLPDHRLIFPRTSDRWQGGGVASVTPDSGQVVWGVVYEITPADLDSLDGFEGCQPGASDNNYNRETIRVYDRGRMKKPLDVQVYRAVPQGQHFAPSAAYMKALLDGADHWKLPELYIEDLKRIETAR